MTRNIRDLIDDERAVSPVIGVILMVAITVILAAVIGTFVLDLGQSAGQTAPQASLSVSVDASTENVTLEHTGGDAIQASDTRVIVEINSSDSQTYQATSTSSQTLTVGGSTIFSLDTGVVFGDLTDLSTTDNNTTIQNGQTVTITVIDTASQRQIFETEVTA